jgi:hypothetical protein
MSHTATVDVEIKDRIAFKDACERLKIKYSMDEEVRLFDGTKVRGMTAYLPGWKYPAVFANGKCYSDTYSGRWGQESELQKLKQAYATCAAKRAAQKSGFRVTEKTMKDGTIQLSCQKG